MKPNSITRREIRKDGREAKSAAYSWEGTDDEDGYEDDDYWNYWTEYDDDDYWPEYDDDY
jgi:hypothetical protein